MSEIADHDAECEAMEREIEVLRKERDALSIENAHLKCVALPALARSVSVLWKAVQDGIYDSREIVGDQTLHMAEVLKEFGRGPLAGK